MNPQANPNTNSLPPTPGQVPVAPVSPAIAQQMGATNAPQPFAQPQMTQPQMAPPAAMPQPPVQMASSGAPNQAPAAALPQTPAIVENPISTQATLQISELRDGIIIMKNGSFRAVVACQSINFDLMSNTEREGVEYSYQNFLNSLTFTTQILIRSQRVDIGPYIDRLSALRRDNDNMLLGVLMDDYINFIAMLSEEANIMDKSFFVVIPYYTSPDAEKLLTSTKNLFRGFSKKAPEVTRINRDVYNKAVDELNNRVEAVISGLFQIGIQSVRLNTRQLSELFYNFNNPDTAVREPLVDFTQLATTFVRKGEKPNGQR